MCIGVTHLVQLLYPPDQQRVTGRVLKINIICKERRREEEKRQSAFRGHPKAHGDFQLDDTYHDGLITHTHAPRNVAWDHLTHGRRPRSSRGGATERGGAAAPTRNQSEALRFRPQPRSHSLRLITAVCMHAASALVRESLHKLHHACVRVCVT